MPAARSKRAFPHHRLLASWCWDVDRNRTAATRGRCGRGVARESEIANGSVLSKQNFEAFGDASPTFDRNVEVCEFRLAGRLDSWISGLATRWSQQNDDVVCRCSIAF